MTKPFAYDELPYPGKFFVQTRPNRLAAIGILYGMRPADAEHCRVLELGCGNGSNLIGQAYSLPASEFVGVDLARVHIEEATSAAAELGLENIEFQQMDLMDMTVNEFGKFDYVIAHGLLAWVPEFVRTRVMALFGELLNPNGIGYVSYNAYPGSHVREMMRSMMRFHTRGIDEPSKKVSDSMALLASIAKNLPDANPTKRIVVNEIGRHRGRPVADFYHDDLGDAYRPFYFYEIAEMLAENGLQFLSEAEINSSSLQGLDKEAVARLEAAGSRTDREQYLDFFRVRVFRQTLFCRSDIELDEDPGPSALDDLYLLSTLRPKNGKADLSEGKVETFVSSRDQQIDIDHPLTKAALVKLGEAWGRSVKTPELMIKARKALTACGVKIVDWEQQREIARKVLFQIAMGTDAIILDSHQPSARTEPSERPRVDRLARWQVKQGTGVLTQLGLDLKLTDKPSHHLLTLLDGSHSRADLAVEMRPFIESADDLSENERTDLLKDLPGWINRSIGQLARLGVFDA